MERRVLVRGLAAALLGIPAYGTAQPSSRKPVVGFLTLAGEDSFAQFRQTMRERGYVDGRNIEFQRRSSAGRPEPLPRLAAELVRLGVDVIYATGPAAVRAAHDATREIPIVAFDLETDPVASGLVQSLNRPGGNLTGLFLDLPGLAGKWLELLHQAIPECKVFYVLWDSTTGPAQLAAARAAAGHFGLELDILEMRDGADLDRALSGAGGAPGRALVALSSPLVSRNSKRIAQFALQHRLPAISAFRSFADTGGLLSYGPNLVAFRRFASAYVDRILKGAKPAELPILQPNTFELVVNLGTATRFGLKIPEGLLLQADDVLK